MVEITLNRQDQSALEQRVALEDAMQPCYCVSPGSDSVLMVHAADMPD